MTDPVLLHEKFSAVARRCPDRRAVAAPEGQISYRDLDAAASRLAATIAPLLGRAGRVMVCLEPGINFITAILAALKAGAAYVPLNHADPVGRIAAMAALPGADLLITGRKMKEDLNKGISLPVYTLEDLEPSDAPTGTAPSRTARDHAYIIHTSGSTGTPKATGISHGALANLLAAFDALCPLRETDLCSLWSALHFDVSIYEIWSALLSGATLFIPQESTRFSPEAFLDWMADRRITSAYIPPFMLEAMAGSRPSLSLRRMLTGVEPIPEPLLCQIKQHIPGLTLINGYGPAEAAVCAALYPVPDTPSRQGRAPIGKAVPNVTITLEAPDGRPVPRGEKGEIVIRGIQVSDGYINAPGQAARAFGNDSGAPLYRTGDLGMELKDGTLLFSGRKDFQIKYKGVRIEPGEIEGLLRKHPGVAQAALILKEIGLKDLGLKKSGPKDLRPGGTDNGTQGLVAYVSPKHGSRLNTTSLVAYLKEMLPRNMMPTAVICLDHLPVTSQGKTDRRALVQRKDPELSESGHRTASGSGNKPGSRIAKIWEAVLNSPVRSGNESFLLLGGDSIAAAAIMARINRVYGTDLPLNLLFDYPEFHRFSAHILENTGEAVRRDAPRDQQVLPPDAPLPLMPDQELIWLFETLYPKTTVYHIPLVFEISGHLDEDRLALALERAVLEHPVLGSVFFMDRDKVRQRWGAPPVRLAVKDSGSREPNLFFRLDDPGIRKWLDREIQRPFNLSRGPLVRAALLNASPGHRILCITVHHLVFDGWSAALFIESLGRAYATQADQGRSALPGQEKKRLQAAARQAFHRYQTLVLHRQKQLFRKWPGARSFFKGYLAGLPELPETSGKAAFAATTCPVVLDAPLYARVRTMARKYRTTRFAILLAIFQITLALRNDRRDQVTGIAYAARDHLESESICGCFMNTLVVRNKIPFQTSFLRFLGQMKNTLDTILRHRDVPFHTLQEFCRKQGHTGPLFDALFLMQSIPLGPLALEDLETRHHPHPPGQSNTALTLELYEGGGGVRGWLKYQTALFSEEEAKDLARTLAAVARLVLDCPDESLETLTEEILDTLPDEADLDRQEKAILSDPLFPLSPMQHGMLMETLRAPQGAGCYVEQVVFTMEEEIDIDRFSAAWQKISETHETLRLGFKWQGMEQPGQFYAPATPLKVDFNDWSNFSAPEKQNYLDMFLKADRRLGFNLDHPPAFRVALFKTEPAGYTCIWSFHHSIGDGRSMAFILGHLFQAYKNPDLTLPAPPSFRRYIAWLNRAPRSKARQFWRGYLSGFTEPMVFPFRTDDPGSQGSRRQSHAMALTTGHHHLALSPVTCRSIRTLCQKNSLSINSFLMGAWAVLLSHYTGKTDILFGATVSTRHFDPSHKEGTGLYINTLPVRIRIRPDQTLTAYIAQIRDQWRQIRTHDHLPLTDIHALSPIQGSTPLSEIYFSYDYQTLDEALGPKKNGISCGSVRLLERTPAAIFLTASGTDTLNLSIEYDRRKFSARTTRQILDHFSFFLKSCTQFPEAPLRGLPVLTERETDLINEKLNTCQGHLPPASSFHQLFEIRAGINPGAPAVEDGQTRYTYGRLNSLANQLARLLIAEGAGPDKKILLLMDQDADLIAAIIGVLKAGACYVPLEATSPGERVRYIMEDCRPDFAITTAAHADKLGRAPVRRLLMDRDRERIRRHDTANPHREVMPGDLAYIIYTSGSTGTPKGVMVSHQSLAAFTKTAAATYEIEASDRMLQFASISFDASVEEIFPTLYAGATLVIKPREVVQTPQAFVSYCRTLELTVIDLPTAYWHMIADEIHTLSLPPRLRLVIIGGDAAHPERVRAWQEAVGKTVRLINTYGPTETTVAVTWEDLSAAPLTSDIVPIGIPFPSVNLSILNHFGLPSPPGVTGELFIGGPQVAQGYLNREEETRNAFVLLEAAGPGLRFFKTGDLAKMLPTGQVIFLGRRDRQVKIRGYRVEPGEIEQTLAACDKVKECALVLTRTPENDIRMTAFVVPDQNSAPDEGQLKEWLKTRLPDYMIPSLFILVKSLPHTPSGKVDYPLLQQSVSSDTLPRTAPAPSSPPPVSREEEETDTFRDGLLEVWEEVLAARGLGPDDNFFDVGGSSLTAIRLVTAIEKRFGISLPVLAVFKFPRLSDLADQLRAKDTTRHFSSVSAVHAGGDKPPIFFVAGTEEQTQNFTENDLGGHPFFTVTVMAHKTRGKQIIPMDIWEIARRNIQEILQADATGPYILIGFCRYCLVAYEIASQLTAMGKPVADLIFIDEFWQKKSRFPKPPHRPKGLGQRFRELLPRTGKALRATLHALNKRREHYYTATGKSVPDDLQASLMESSFWKAYDGYMPMPYPGDLVVLDSRGWRKEYAPRLRSYVQGNVRRFTVKATHDSWFEPAQIRAIMAAVNLPDRD